VFDLFDRGFQVVEEGMDVGQTFECKSALWTLQTGREDRYRIVTWTPALRKSAIFVMGTKYPAAMLA
jgi:hypothetical protein